MEDTIYSITSSSVTETGKVRKINEDAVLESGNLFAVADGMGGHQAGEVASSMALGVVGQYVEDNIGLISGERLVEKAASAANAAVFQKASSSAKYRQMGTTLTLMYREGDTAYIAHVGDSRAYLFREGTLQRLTRDHSLVATLVEEGEITEEQAMHHPQRNIILKALGLEPQVEVDVSAVKILPGDIFMIASDGLTGLVPDSQISSTLAEPLEPEGWARRLADMALNAGGTDNVSVVVVRILESATVIPVRGARPLEENGNGTVAGAPSTNTPSDGKNLANRRRLRNWVIAGLIVIILLAAGFGVAFYFYNRTYWVGVKGGKVTLFRGFPFWNLATVERQTDVKSEFLPEALRLRVDNKLEPESRSEALKTLASLEREAAKNSSIVPDVQGKKYPAAKDTLEKLGLRPEPELVSRTGMAADLVIDQTPVPGTRVGKGTAVRLKVVMAGSKPKEV
ncbi:MAG: Stp1/IreP family PP2C-type Ser/Thr phosphatase [Candidatus Geothermincolia bacterium]